jgi:hypothetical protein
MGLISKLDRILEEGGSVWKVGVRGKHAGLERRISFLKGLNPPRKRQ